MARRAITAVIQRSSVPSRFCMWISFSLVTDCVRVTTFLSHPSQLLLKTEKISRKVLRQLRRVAMGAVSGAESLCVATEGGLTRAAQAARDYALGGGGAVE